MANPNMQPLRENDNQLRQRPRHGSRTRNIEDVYDPVVAVDLATHTVDENVFLFPANLIGYVRVILAGASLFFMPDAPVVCTVLYGVSCLLDAVDGPVARILDQASRFGAVLDMVTDRCTTAVLLCFLASTDYYRSYGIVFQFLIALDFASHWIHMYSSLVTGSSSHKQIGSDVSRILHLYYTDRTTLFIFCFCNELFFVCLYLNAVANAPPISSYTLPHFFASTFVGKMFPSVVRVAASITWPQLIGILNFPICFGKQIINVVQFWKASKILVGIDLIEREKDRARKAKELQGGPAVVE